MKRTILIITLILAGCVAQLHGKCIHEDNITIVFKRNAGEDFELYIKAALDHLNIKSTISYNSISMNNGIFITYSDSVNGYNLKGLNVRLIKNNVILKEEKFSSNIFRSTLRSKKICFDLVGKLFDTEISASRKEKKITYPRLCGSAHIRKINKNVYMIETKGAAMYSESNFIDAFHIKAKSLMKDYTGYEYYLEAGKYKYSAPSPMGSTHHTADRVIGIIILNKSNKISELKQYPEELF